ncbi:AAA family ATPase [Gemmata sp.]|uniref:AAA family ATPase n=1 Tax=Gemmata sp. TaxID=1914242 RepID=UPI003F70F4F6
MDKDRSISEGVVVTDAAQSLASGLALAEVTPAPNSDLLQPRSGAMDEVSIYFDIGGDVRVMKQLGHRVDRWVQDGKLKIVEGGLAPEWVVATRVGSRLRLDGPYRHAFAVDDRYDLGSLIRDLVPLDDDAVRTIALALDGVADNSVTALELRAGNTRAGDGARAGCELWTGRLCRGEVAMLAGAPNAGKSTLLRRLLHAGAGTEPGKLLGAAVSPFGAFVVSEEPARLWHGAPDDTRIRFISENPMRKFGEFDAYVQNLGRVARAGGSRLVVLDTLSRLFSFDENSSRAVVRTMAPLRVAAAQYDLCVLVVHHTGRNGVVRGSTALEAQVDAVLTVGLTGDSILDTRRRLDVVSRAAPTERIEYAMDPSGALVPWSPSPDGAAAKAPAKSKLLKPKAAPKQQTKMLVQATKR